jgi:hypothetical protein
VRLHRVVSGFTARAVLDSLPLSRCSMMVSDH